MTLDDFIQSHINGSFQRSAWVSHTGFNSMYVRCTERYIDGAIVNTIDLANIEAENPGNSAFRNLIAHIQKSWPQYTIYVESVLTNRFRNGLLKMGFKEDCTSFNFWLDKLL